MVDLLYEMYGITREELITYMSEDLNFEHVTPTFYYGTPIMAFIEAAEADDDLRSFFVDNKLTLDEIDHLLKLLGLPKEVR